MPNHLHVFLKTTSCANISQVIGAIKSKTVVDLRKRGVTHPLWQARFYHKVKYKEKTFQETLRYIKNNPVKAGLEEKYHKLPYLYICETGLKLQ